MDWNQISGERYKYYISVSYTHLDVYKRQHHALYICNDSGQIACQYCTNVRQVVFRDVKRSFKNAYVKVYDAEYVCPPLTSENILYQSDILPVYSYMIPEGQYPSLPQSSKSVYANCVCHVHATGSVVHYYGYTGGGADDQSQVPAEMPQLLSPSRVQELYAPKS